jgi:hypothetical protein
LAHIKPVLKVLTIEILVIIWLLVFGDWLLSPAKPTLSNKGNIPER